MPIVKLSSQVVSMASCPPGKRRLDLYDDGSNAQGLLVEVRKGSKTFAVRFTRDGKMRQIALGSTRDITFAQAVKAARKLRAEAVLGGDPLADKAERRAVPTYAELAKLQIENARTYARSIKTIEGYINNHLVPKWGKKRITEITQRDVTLWLAEKDAGGLKPATVEKLRVIMGKGFQLAIDWDLPGAGKNPTRGIKRPPINNARQRYLTADEAARLYAAVARSGNPSLKYIVGLLLLTGARLGELRMARWSDFDLARQVWYLKRTKTGKSRVIPLSGAAVDLIGQLPRHDHCEWLLPNPRTLKPWVTIKRAFATACKEAKLHGLTRHDLRHAFASFALAAGGSDLFTVGRILGHADHRSTMRYGHLANDTLLAAAEAGAAKLGLDWT
jgi:integrase